MSKLKQQIRETEDELALTDLYIQQQFAELESNPHMPGMFSLVLFGGLVSGYVIGKRASFKFKTLYKLPFKITKFFATVKSIGMMIS